MGTSLSVLQIRGETGLRKVSLGETGFNCSLPPENASTRTIPKASKLFNGRGLIRLSREVLSAVK
jgi:hypothetical protein